jgi:hypothetical protein
MMRRAYGVVVWAGPPDGARAPWPPDTRVPYARRISLDVFFALHRLALLERLNAYVVEARRRQLIREWRTRYHVCYAKVESTLDVERVRASADKHVVRRSAWERGMAV